MQKFSFTISFLWTCFFVDFHWLLGSPTTFLLLTWQNSFWFSIFYVLFSKIFDALRNLLPFVQFKKREKHPWRSVTLNCTNGTKLRKTEHMKIWTSDRPISLLIILCANVKYYLSHGTECRMTNILRVSYILQLPAFIFQCCKFSLIFM